MFITIKCFEIKTIIFESTFSKSIFEQMTHLTRKVLKSQNE